MTWQWFLYYLDSWHNSKITRTPKARPSSRWLYEVAVVSILSGPDNIKLEFILRLKIKRNDWRLADTCPQAANHCALLGVRDCTQVLYSQGLDSWHNSNITSPKARPSSRLLHEMSVIPILFRLLAQFKPNNVP